MLISGSSLILASVVRVNQLLIVHYRTIRSSKGPAYETSAVFLFTAVNNLLMNSLDINLCNFPTDEALQFLQKFTAQSPLFP